MFSLRKWNGICGKNEINKEKYIEESSRRIRARTEFRIVSYFSFELKTGKKRLSIVQTVGTYGVIRDRYDHFLGKPFQHFQSFIVTQDQQQAKQVYEESQNAY